MGATPSRGVNERGDQERVPGIRTLTPINKGRQSHRRLHYLNQPSVDNIENAVALIGRVAAYMEENTPDLTSRLDRLGAYHTDRLRTSNEPIDLEMAIKCEIFALFLTPQGHLSLARRFADLASSHVKQYQDPTNKKPEIIARAIHYSSRSLSLLSTNDPDLSQALHRLGTAYGMRYEDQSDLDDADKAAEYLTRALSLAAVQELPQRLHNLGSLYWTKFQKLGDLEELEKAIEYASRLRLVPEGHPELSRYLEFAAFLFGERQDSRNSHGLGDLESEIECLTRSESITPGDHPGLLPRLKSLSRCHWGRFQYTSSPNDLEKALEYTFCAFSLMDDDDPELPSGLNAVSLAHEKWFLLSGDPDDLGQMIKYETFAMSLALEDHPEFHSILSNLSKGHYHRYNLFQDPKDLEMALGDLLRSVSYTSKGGYGPCMTCQFERLGAVQFQRFQLTKDVEDLSKGIEYTNRTIGLPAEGHMDQWKPNALLASLHLARFEHLGKLPINDIEKAIEYNARSLLFYSGDDPDVLRRTQRQLGKSYFLRFWRVGDVSDIDKAINHHSCALSATPNDHSDLPKQFQLLGQCIGERFRRLRYPDDIRKSIEYHARSVSLTPSADPELLMRLSNLATTYRDYYQYTHEPDALERSIACSVRALTLSSGNNPELDWHELGAAYGDRFQYTRNPDDNEKALEYMSREMELRNEGDPRLPIVLEGLGNMYLDRLRYLKEPNNLLQAIDLHYRALSLTSEDHPHFPRRLIHLSRSHLRRLEHSGGPADLQRVFDCLSKASKSLVAAPRDKFGAAVQLARIASVSPHAYPSTASICIESYQTAIDLIPQLVWIGTTTKQRYLDVSIASSLAVEAAAFAISINNYTQALEWLEHARCVVWNQTLLLRPPLESLRSSYPDISDRFQRVVDQLRQASSDPRMLQVITPDNPNMEDAAQQYRVLAKEYDALVSQIRSLDGFEGFLRPTRANKLMCAAQNGPVVIINCHESRCDALVVLPDHNEVNFLALPNFSREKADYIWSGIQGAIKGKGLRERGWKKKLLETQQKDSFESLLATLWFDVAKPVLNFLGYTEKLRKDTLPHITWCPTGVASLLPLHAAGDYERPDSRVFDYVVSSYTPTLTALLSAPNQLSQSSGLLVVSQEATPGHNPLPGTLEELTSIECHAQHLNNFLQLTNNNATKASVLDAMQRYGWVHLACHAHQNIRDPTESGFCLHDGTLDLATIAQQSFKNKGLAFLSACQTATGSELLPDEAAHLASGMLMAGYPSVIATMWSVLDEDAPFVADKVYGQLLSNEGTNISNGSAAKALHNATTDLREKVGYTAFERWVPYIHLGI